METIYAAMLLHKAGKEVNEAELEKVLKAAGSNVDKSQIKATVVALKNVDIDKAISEAPVVAAQAPVASVASTTEEKKEDNSAKEEKSEEDKKKEEEDAAEGLGALFG